MIIDLLNISSQGSLDKTMDENEATMASLKADHEEEIASLKNQHSTEVEKLTTTFQAEISVRTVFVGILFVQQHLCLLFIN